MGYVWNCNHFGAMAMQANLRHDGDLRWLELVTAGSWWQQLYVEDLGDRLELRCTTLSAAPARRQFGDKAACALASCMLLWMVQDVDPISISEAGVTMGFKWLSVAVCSKLLNELDAQWLGRKPTLDADMLHFLMSTICPYLSESELQQGFAERVSRHSSVSEIDIIEESVGLIGGIVEQAEQEELVQEVAKRSRKPAKKAAEGRGLATEEPAGQVAADQAPQQAVVAPGAASSSSTRGDGGGLRIPTPKVTSPVPRQGSISLMQSACRLQPMATPSGK